MTVLGTVVPITPLEADDTTYHNFTNDIDLEVASYALGDMPGDFGNMDDLSYDCIYLVSGAPSDDVYGLNIRITNGGTILAAADAGGTYEVVNANITNTSENTKGVTGFTYVNTGANKATWDGASVDIQQRHAKTKGNDGIHVQVDYTPMTGNYTISAGISIPVLAYHHNHHNLA